MATITTKRLVCDHHCNRGEEVDADHRRYVISGKRVTKDLCVECDEATTAAILELLDTRKSVPKRRRVTVKPTAAQVRRWAKDSGVEVSPRGTIPDDVMERYLAAQ